MNIALILSGGTGTRLGGAIPKQYIEVESKPILIYAMETLAANSNIEAIQIVADGQWHDDILAWIDKFSLGELFKGFSAPGENRQCSILNGLRDISQYAKESDYVLIHDAARPLLSQELIDEIFADMTGHDGVLPVLPMKDTIYLSKDGGSISSLLDRSQLFAGQAPELFNLGKYLEANEKLLKDDRILKINGSTEPAIMAGMNIAMVPGEEDNFKITTLSDLNRFKKIIKEKK